LHFREKNSAPPQLPRYKKLNKNARTSPVKIAGIAITGLFFLIFFPLKI
jgi:hypothetical protein